MAIKGLIATCLLLIICSLCSCHRGDTLFTSLSASSTNIQFRNDLEKKDLFNILYYLYYYNGGGVSIGDINNDGLPDIYFTANSNGHNKLYLNRGNFQFEDITDKAGVAGTSDWCSGVTMADVNGDGYLDIYVSAVAQHHGLEGNNELFINNHNGTFTERAAEYGLNFSGFTSQTVFFDYDNDGDLDCFILNQSHKPNENIVDTSNRKKFDPLAGDRLYRNDLNTAAKKFVDVSAQAGIYQSSLGYGLGISVADFNNDGYADIYIGNDFHENDYYYLNNGNGTFTESGAKHFGHYSRFSMGNDAADYNNDGQIDLVTVDMLPPDEKTLKTYGSDENADIYKFKLIANGFQYQYSRNCLQRNNGNGSSFSEIGLQSGISATDWSWSPLLADFDNDGNKDLFISSGIVKRPVDLDYIRFISDIYNHKVLNTSAKYDDKALERMPDGASHPFLFKGDGKMTFTDVSEQWGTQNMNGYYNGAAYADLDNDGRLDLVINSLNAPAVILKNNSPKKNYLTLTFQGSGMNTFGIGTKAYVFVKGKLQYQQLMLTRGFQSSSDTRLHFGLGEKNKIDSLLIVWPDQRFQLIKNVSGNKIMKVYQKDAAGKFSYASFFPPVNDHFQPVPGLALDDWKHRENPFFDNNIQYLIPHEESTRGPKLAVADVNNDGLDDVFACGAKGQGGTLLIQKADGSFFSSQPELFSLDSLSENVDAQFADVNNDGFKDLYVVNGGNEAEQNNPVLADLLYLNDGKGHFRKSLSLPRILNNKSCIAFADIDNDGDSDMFVGTLADAKAYGVPQDSHLLINDGKGNFTEAPTSLIDLRKIGMITAAQFADVNHDKLPDLILAGEWMPLTVFINRKNNFEKTEIPGSSGLWQCLFVDDVNGDGNPDFLAGNWGWNNKFHAGKDGPIRLYVSDFDHNGQIDQLLSYTVNGQEFPFLAKDELERPLPTLKKHYLSYSEFAGVAMKDVFYGWIDSVSPLICEKLGSAVAYGNGKGSFTLKELPAELQLSPVFSFQKIDKSGSTSYYMAGGNFYDVIPYEGRYDAQPLSFFSIDKNDSAKFIRQQNLLDPREQVRDIKWLQTVKNGKVLAVAGNDVPVLFYQFHK